MASFTLETRPISARPFKLENAKPWDDWGSLAMVGAPLTGFSACRDHASRAIWPAQQRAEPPPGGPRRTRAWSPGPRVSPNPKYSKKKDDEVQRMILG